jgi:HlyD family secretion protein
MQKKTVLIIISAAIVLCGAGFYLVRGADGLPPVLATVKKGTFVREVSASGRVEPPATLDLHFKTGGKIAELNIKTGDRVEAGQILARLDAGDLEAEFDQVQEGVFVAEARLNQLLAGSSSEDVEIYRTSAANAQDNLENLQRIQDIARQNVIDALRDAYAKADDSIRNRTDRFFTDSSTRNASFGITIDYGDTKYPIIASDTDTELKINAERVEIEDILRNWEGLAANPDLIKKNPRDATDNAGRDLEKIQVFLNDVALVVNSYNSSRPADDQLFQNYRSDIAAARTNVSAAVSGVALASEALERADVNAVAAEGALKTAQNQLALKIAPARQSDAAVYLSQIDQARAAKRQVEKQIRDMSIVAPESGTIVEVNGDVGEMAGSGAGAVSMISDGTLRVKLNVSENNIVNVKIGQDVDMTLDAFGDDRHFYGKVAFIDPAGTNISGAVYYKTTVDFDELDESIRPDMTVNAYVETATHYDALYIPIGVVQISDGRKFVQILKDDKVAEKDVQTGIEDNRGMIEIVSGLEEGQEIISKN